MYKNMSKWNAILKTTNESKKNIKVYPADPRAVVAINEVYDIDAESTLGAVLNNCGGITVDNWIRLYGAGEIDFCTHNAEYNIGCIVIAEDVVGGLFILLESGNIGYFAPDTLEIEKMDMSYSQFLFWCIQGDTDSYYRDFRWTGWESDLINISVTDGMSFYPYLWAEAESINSRSKRQIPMNEIIAFEIKMHSKL